ncbi:hypothetical protein Syun_020132 [Stephania yunnanensis]|uniref:CRAL-TRIO domain-containing protein n=1 Tax=Stephania yunnanensis TaxID=152371 RepID=A0AAP0NPQ1_9MAGN
METEKEKQSEEVAMDELDGTEMEKNKVGLMRVRVEAQDPTAKAVDDLMIRRFLRARNLDIEKASTLFLNYLKWKREFVPKGFICESEIEDELAQLKAYLPGHDRLGRPYSVILGRKHIPVTGQEGLEQFKRYMVYCLDKLCAKVPKGHEKYCSITDLQGWGFSNNFDLRGYATAISIMQDYYPERLGKLFLVHVPYVFAAAWKLICPFIDKKTREKVVFVDNKSMRSTLLEHFSEDQLPEIYGGKKQLLPMQDA